jgi:hypothetical protein
VEAFEVEAAPFGNPLASDFANHSFDDGQTFEVEDSPRLVEDRGAQSPRRWSGSPAAGATALDDDAALRAAFDACDLDGRGTLDAEELAAVLQVRTCAAH